MPIPVSSIHQSRCHLGWHRDQAPVLTIAPGETVEFDCQEASGGQLTPISTLADFRQYDTSGVNPLTGPVFVDGAEPGDTLAITIGDFATSGWGWTGILPEFGLLADEFPDHHLIVSRHNENTIEFLPGVQLPLRPFIGTLGIAPAAAGRHSVIPPRRVGGNMDCRDLIAGTRVLLPVEVPGALLSAGDTHVAQGDGEVCGTAVESPMRVTLSIDLVKGGAPAFPRLELPAGPLRTETAHGHLVTTGIGPDLMAAARNAIRELIDALCRNHGMKPEDAYCLASVSADLHISEVVDAPNWLVAAYLPLALFG